MSHSILARREAGHAVISILEEAPASKDREVLNKAHREGLIVLTFDKDYGELIYKEKASAPGGLVFFRFAPAFPEEPARILLKAMKERTLPLSQKFTVIERDGIRQRALSVVK
ncbi:MAG: DUF5615 family PIN-like protein [Candidatus Eremiobacteraeota bacterium]|nr:DUF5615 family PIN-like protein [Candidatus Eremiobacteraeota bacterium]